MSLVYAPRGLVGVLTPQANTTVEPELAILTPPGQAFITARLTSDKATIPDRLRDYFDGYCKAARAFANAPLSALGFACTGASYLAGVAREDALRAELQDALGIPVVTAATAVVDALDALGAERIALLSPYDADLDAASAAYWTARGRQVVRRVSAFAPTDDFHPIYAMSADRATRGLSAVADAGAEAIVMLGTGMPTLPAIAEHPRVGGAVLMSCMSCFTWRLYGAAAGAAPTAESLRAFHEDPVWRARLRVWLGQRA
jgi:maleate cis-trans isomerase